MRDYVTCPPPGGKVDRYERNVELLGEELAWIDRRLAEVAAAFNIAPQKGNLAGRFQHSLFMRLPADRREFESFVQARDADDILYQSNALPGTRFYCVGPSDQFHTATARMATYQLAAYVAGNNLTAEGLAGGAAKFPGLAPDCRVFCQCMGLYLGALAQGPGTFYHPAFVDLLKRRNQHDLAGEAGVGAGDVPTLGAVAAALDRGSISLNDVLSADAIGHPPRFLKILAGVLDGGFNQALAKYDVTEIVDESKRPVPNLINILYASPKPAPTLLLARLDLDGDGIVRGPELAAALSNFHDLLNLTLSGARPDADAPAVIKEMFKVYEPQGHGLCSPEQIRELLKDIDEALNWIYAPRTQPA